MAAASITSGTFTVPSPATGGGTNSSTLSEYVGPYVTNMLGKAQASANEPYQTYQGPLTAGPSALQTKMFQGLGNLAFPSNLGQSFSSTGAYQIPQYNAAGLMRGGPMSSGVGGGGAMPVFGETIQGGSPPIHSNTSLEDQQRIRQLQERGNGGPPGSQPSPFLMMPGGSMMPSQLQQAMQEATEYGKQQGIEPAQPMSLEDQQRIRQLFEGNDTPGGPMPGGATSGSGTNVASNYMNPYLQNVLTPQLDELRRQYDISGNQLNAKAVSQGAFGGSRNALQSAENDRNMMQEMNKTIGTGYANAYDKAMNQFNTEQGQSKTLADMIATQGGIQQGLEQQGVTADYNEFINQRDYPQTQLKFLQSMLQGLPISTVYNTPTGQTPGQQGVGNVSSAAALLQELGVIPRTPAAT